jgi:acyl-coenzyme A synthetase/AMP-(fatty) acid ligase
MLNMKSTHTHTHSDIHSHIDRENGRVEYTSDGRILSPYPPLSLPIISFHENMFESWKTKGYGALPALTDAITGHTLNYYDVYNHILALSNGLHKQCGVREGSMVAIYAPNHLLYPIAVYALSMLGAVTAFINPAYQAKELVHHLQDSAATHLITSIKQLPVVHSVQQTAAHVKHILTFDEQDTQGAADGEQQQQR